MKIKLFKKNLFNVLGYYKLSELTNDQLDKLFIDRLNLDVELTDEQAIEMFESLKKVPHFKEYLVKTASADLRRFFTVQKEEQDLVRGAILRTRYLLGMLTGSEKKLAELRLPRYS